MNELSPEGLKLPGRPWFSSSWDFWMMMDKSVRSILGKKNLRDCFFSFSGSYSSWHLFPVFSVPCFAHSYKYEIHTDIVNLSRLFGWCNPGHRNMWEATMQAAHHRDLGKSRRVEHSSGQKEMVTFALGSCLHFRVVNQAKRGGETRPAAQLQCPTSALKKGTDCSNHIYFKNSG